MAEKTAQPTLEVHVEASDDVPARFAEYARTKLLAASRYTAEPILHVRARLSFAGDPAVERRAVAQANLDWNGRLLRAQVAAPTMTEAIDRLQARLRDRMEHLSRDWEALRGRRPGTGPHQWRHVSQPTRRPPWFPRPPEEREIMRRKSFTLRRSTPEEAAFDMEMLDYDFLLFVEEGTGCDSVIYRADSGYRIAQVDGAGAPPPPGAVPVTVSEQPVPLIEVDEAVRRMNALDLPFLFFADPATGRGSVLYHRYEGHYGLISPPR